MEENIVTKVFCDTKRKAERKEMKTYLCCSMKNKTKCCNDSGRAVKKMTLGGQECQIRKL